MMDLVHLDQVVKRLGRRRRGSPPPGCRQAGEGITDGN